MMLASIGSGWRCLRQRDGRGGFVDSFKTARIADRVWRTQTQLELAIVAYVGWFNHQRLHSALGDIPPAEHEALHEFRYAAARH